MTIEGSSINPVDKETKIKGSYYAKKGTEIGPGIDIQFSIHLQGDASYTKADDNKLKIDATITGNIFPAQETMIFDEKGVGLSLGVSTAKGGPLSGVQGFGEGNVLSKKSVLVQVDQKGNFPGVYSKDKKGNDIVISPQAYNDQFTSQKVWNEQDSSDDY